MRAQEKSYTFVNVIGHYQQLNDNQKMQYNVHFSECFRLVTAAYNGKKKAGSLHASLELYSEMPGQRRLNTVLTALFLAADRMPSVKQQLLETKDMLFLNPEHAQSYAQNEKSPLIRSQRSAVRLIPAVNELTKINLIVEDCVTGMDVLSEAIRYEQLQDLEYMLEGAGPLLRAMTQPSQPQLA